MSDMLAEPRSREVACHPSCGDRRLFFCGGEDTETRQAVMLAAEQDFCNLSGGFLVACHLTWKRGNLASTRANGLGNLGDRVGLVDHCTVSPFVRGPSVTDLSHRSSFSFLVAPGGPAVVQPVEKPQVVGPKL